MTIPWWEGDTNMQQLTRLLWAFVLILASFFMPGTSETSAGSQNATPQIAAARTAIGGEKQLSKVRGLSLAGTLQRTVGDRTVDGEVAIDIELPDKMLRTDNISPVGDGTQIVTTQGVNGDTLLRGSRIVNAPPGAVIR